MISLSSFKHTQEPPLMKDVSYIEHHKGGTSMVGSKAVDLFAMLTVIHALELHVKTGGAMRLTRMATPKAMMARASDYTGKKFKARDYAGAAKALREHYETCRGLIPECTAA